MKRRIVYWLLPLCVAGGLNAQVNAPQIGVARFPDHTLHRVFGIAANFIVGDPVLGSADAASFSNAGGLIAKNGQIQLLGTDLSVIAEYSSGESAPLLNIDGDLTTAIAWLPNLHALLRWDGHAFAVTQTADVSLLSHVTSVRVQNSSAASLLILEPGGTVSEAEISLDSGNLITLHLLPGVSGTAFEQHSFIVFHDQAGLEIASPTGIVRTIPLPANDITIERMSPDWLHLISADSHQNWILHLTSTVLQLFELPAAAQEDTK